MLQYAKDNPDEDKEEVIAVPPQELQAVDNKIPEMSDAEMEQMIAEAEKRDCEFLSTLPLASKQRVADPEGVKRSQANQPPGQAKFVKFDHTETEEKKPKQSRTSGMFSPTLAGDLVSSPSASASSPSTATGYVRRIVDEVELYDEDECEEEIPLETWDWDVNDQLLGGDFADYEISSEDKGKRGFFNEDAGPPQVSAEELAYLDKQAMYAELERWRQLEAISDVQAEVDVSEAAHLDTKLVRDWRFRQGCWIRRVRMVAREFRGQSASKDEPFSPTTPWVLVKVLMVISMVKGLMMSALDVSDAFLQVWQKENVVVSVPNWVRVAAKDISLMFWQLRKCLPGQRNAATRCNDHLTQLLEELNFTHMQGTIFRHKEKEIYISAHIDDFTVGGKQRRH